MKQAIIREVKQQLPNKGKENLINFFAVFKVTYLFDLFVFCLSSDTNVKSKYLQEELWKTKFCAIKTMKSEAKKI